MTNRPTGATQRLYGIEFELEGVRIDDVPRGWRAEHDGTLREGGIEFVSRTPASAEDTLELSRALFDKIKRYRVSHRCSTHLHVNAPTTNVRRLVMYSALLSLESHLFNTYAPARINNNYCVPGLRSAAGVAGIGHLCGNDWFAGVGDNKYSATNYAALNRHGTIELRHFSPLVELDQLAEVLSLVETAYGVVDKVPNRAAMSQAPRVLRSWENHPDPDSLAWVVDTLDTFIAR